MSKEEGVVVALSGDLSIRTNTLVTAAVAALGYTADVYLHRLAVVCVPDHALHRPLALEQG